MEGWTMDDGSGVVAFHAFGRLDGHDLEELGCLCEVAEGDGGLVDDERPDAVVETEGVETPPDGALDGAEGDGFDEGLLERLKDVFLELRVDEVLRHERGERVLERLADGGLAIQRGGRGVHLRGACDGRTRKNECEEGFCWVGLK